MLCVCLCVCEREKQPGWDPPKVACIFISQRAYGGAWRLYTFVNQQTPTFPLPIMHSRTTQLYCPRGLIARLCGLGGWAGYRQPTFYQSTLHVHYVLCCAHYIRRALILCRWSFLNGSVVKIAVMFKLHTNRNSLLHCLKSCIWEMDELHANSPQSKFRLFQALQIWLHAIYCTQTHLKWIINYIFTSARRHTMVCLHIHTYIFISE